MHMCDTPSPTLHNRFACVSAHAQHDLRSANCQCNISMAAHTQRPQMLVQMVQLDINVTW